MQVATRVNVEQASKLKSGVPIRHYIGEGRRPRNRDCQPRAAGLNRLTINALDYDNGYLKVLGTPRGIDSDMYTNGRRGNTGSPLAFTSKLWRETVFR